MIKKIMNNEDAETVMLNEVLEAVTNDNVIDMLFMSDEGFQTVSILVEDDQGNNVNYLMKVITCEEIVAVNQLISSFNLGITVEFLNYDQYDHFIDYCMNLVNTKRKATA